MKIHKTAFFSSAGVLVGLSLFLVGLAGFPPAAHAQAPSGVLAAMRGTWYMVARELEAEPGFFLAIGDDYPARFHVYGGVASFEPLANPSIGYFGASLMRPVQGVIQLQRIGQRTFEGQGNYGNQQLTYMITVSVDGNSIHVVQSCSPGAQGCNREVYLVRSYDSIPTGLPFASCPILPNLWRRCE